MTLGGVMPLTLRSPFVSRSPSLRRFDVMPLTLPSWAIPTALWSSLMR